MSGIADLYNVPNTPEEWAQWSFAHAAHHHDIIRVLYETTGLSLSEFVLDPFDPRTPETWLTNHQVMHAQQDLIVGVAPFNLQQVDFTNPEQTAGWIFLNATEHKQAADVLGIG